MRMANLEEGEEEIGEANDVMDINDVGMTNQKEDSKGERSVVLLGTKQKAVFFKQICNAAEKYERHVHYQDVHYLTVDHLGQEHIIEVSDPGLARTGGREMALRGADYVILYYSSLSFDSLQALQNLTQSLQLRKNMPILIVCDSDEVISDETSSANISSASEGYESDDREGMKRHYSMEQMRRSLDDNSSPVDQGEKLAEELGPRCSYMKISAGKLEDAQKVLTQLIVTITKSAPRNNNNRRKSLIKEILRSKSTDKTGEIEPSGEKKNGKKGKNQDESKVCIVM